MFAQLPQVWGTTVGAPPRPAQRRRPGAQAVCPEERAVAVETGAGRVAATLRWLHGRRFMAPAQLARFDSVVPAPAVAWPGGRGATACNTIPVWLPVWLP
jgi:hypothetical protein